MANDDCKNPKKIFSNDDIYRIYSEKERVWKHATANQILSGLMGNYQKE